MNKIKQILKSKNLKILLGLFLFFLLFFVVFGSTFDPVFADEYEESLKTPTEETVLSNTVGIKERLLLGAAWMVYGVVWAIGVVLLFIIDNLFTVAKWNHFIDVKAVQTGWVIVRDLCNMSFVLILLVIAFATILRRESYNAKRLLPKLLIMAVLINFSKMICGYIIDFSQVIMLSFLSVLDNATIHSLPIALGMDKLISIAKTAIATKEGDFEVSGLQILGALLAALGAAIVAFVVILVMFVMLIFRVIMLWVYVILSPIAFLTAAFPAGQKYSSQWWGEFIKQVITGPILAFFLYLALTTVNDSMDALQEESIKSADLFKSQLPSDFWTGEVFLTYIITLALLVGGLVVAQQAGGIAGSVASRGLGSLQKGGKFIGGGTKRLAISGAKAGAKAAGRGALWGTGAALTKTPLKKVDTLRKAGEFSQSWRKDLLKTRDDAKAAKRYETLNKMGIKSEDSRKAVKDLANSRGGRYAKATVAALGGAGLMMTGNFIGAAAVTTGAVLHAGRVRRQKGKEDAIENRENKAKETMNREIETADNERKKIVKPIEDKRDNNMKRAEENRDMQIERQERRYDAGQISEQDMNSAVDRFNNAFEHEKKIINDEYEKEMKSHTVTRANQKYEKDVRSAKDTYNAEHNAIKPEKENMSTWHPQKITINAANSGLKDTNNARKRVDALAGGENISDMGKIFYSAGGFNSSNKAIFNELAASNEKSAKALSTMVNTLKSIQRDGATATQLESVRNLKQGFAAYQKDGGEMKDFTPVIEVINEIKTGNVNENKDHGYKVDDFEEKVIVP